MFKVRIIPCLDVTAGRVVKGVKFQQLRDAGDPVACARAYDEPGADELTFLDITAATTTGHHAGRGRGHRGPCFMPLTVGGGLRSVEDIRAMLNAGADKVSLNTAAIRSPELVRQAARRFGNQCIVVAIDARRDPGRSRAGASSPTAAAIPPSSTRSSGPAPSSPSAPAKSC